MNEGMSAEDEIVWHTGMEERLDLKGTPNLWAELSQLRDLEQVAAAFDTVMRTFSRLNVEINGAVPSEVIGGSPVISRRLCRAVAEIGSMCHEALQAKKPPELAALINRERRRIEIAWIAVLDGDIDSIEEHVEGELEGKKWGQSKHKRVVSAVGREPHRCYRRTHS